MIDLKALNLPENYSLEDIEDVQEILQEHGEDLNQSFAEFEHAAKEVLAEVKSVMSKKIDTDPVVLEEDLMNCNSLSYTVGSFVADSDSFVLLYEVLYFTPKTTKLTETDRKQSTGVKTIRQSNLCATLRKLEQKLEQRQSALQSILKYETSRMLKG